MTLPIISRKTKTRNRLIKLLTLFATLLLFSGVFSTLYAKDIPVEVTNIISLFENGEVAKAERALANYEGINPGSEYFPVIWMAAARAGNSVISAASYYRKVSDNFPKSPLAPHAQIELAQLMFVHGNATGASAEARRFLRNYPKHQGNFDALMLLAAINAQSGKVGLAANLYAEAAVRFDKHSKSARAYVGLGDCKFRLDDFTGARDAYWKALEKHDSAVDIGKVYYQLGLIAIKRDRPGEARRYFLLLLRNYPKSRYSNQAQSMLDSVGHDASRGSIVGNNTLAPLVIPKVSYAVKVGSFTEKEKADKLSQRFVKAGHVVSIILKNNRYEVLVGRFSGEMDTFVFAEQLERKFGVRTEIVQLEK